MVFIKIKNRKSKIVNKNGLVRRITKPKKISKIFYRYEKKLFPKKKDSKQKRPILDLVENPDAFVYSINHEDENIGYCVIWELQNFIFRKHFEVLKNLEIKNLEKNSGKFTRKI